MKITDQQPIHERVRIIEEALAQCLDRDETMIVEKGDPFTTCLFVLASPYGEERVGHDLHEIAKDLELLLS